MWGEDGRRRNPMTISLPLYVWLLLLVGRPSDGSI
nr:MAG TPA: hypothetical protein [Caudoviricetes sp.]